MLIHHNSKCMVVWLPPLFKRLFVCVCVSTDRWGGWAIWYVWQTIRSSSPSETAENEQVYLRGGSHRAFPQSLIRDSGNEEEAQERGDGGRWRWRRARTGRIGIWQRENRDRGKWIPGDNQIMSIRCYFLLH